MSTIDVRVPDLGDFKDVPVIEVLVKPGDRVKKNDALVTLESDKASMEVPSDVDGQRSRGADETFGDARACSQSLDYAGAGCAVTELRSG